MTEYIHNVSLSTHDDLLRIADSRELTIETYEGVLNDLYIIYADKEIAIGNRQGYDYIVCYYTYASSNHNNLHIMLTDDYDEVIPFIPTDLMEEEEY